MVSITTKARIYSVPFSLNALATPIEIRGGWQTVEYGESSDFLCDNARLHFGADAMCIVCELQLFRDHRSGEGVC
jgi:hypothetical protein